MTKGGPLSNMTHNVVCARMKQKRPLKILALILAFSLMGGMVPHAFADCDSPCCGSKGCHPKLEPTIRDRCHLVDIFVKKIESTTCNMNKVPNIEGTQGVCLTIWRAERPAPGVYAVLSYELRPLSNPFEGPVRRPLNLSRAAPEPLYLQNLTLLI